MKFKIEQIDIVYNKIRSDLKSNATSKEIKQNYLGKKGELKNLLSKIKDIEPKQRANYGKEVNQLKDYLEGSLEQRPKQQKKNQLGTRIDITAPFGINAISEPSIFSKTGSQHPLTKELEEILSIFESMGFNIEESLQIDDEYHMFDSLNFPKGHPARDNWDTFWTEEHLTPPAHTSTMQNRVLKKYDLPIRVVMPGRCYRNEATDAGHEHTLHQIEGVYIDENISLSHMIGTIKSYLESFFGKSLEIKLQPAFFPFTEPDLEFLISCPFCNKTGCSTCGNSGWIEAMGCGMIHPFVLKEANIDPEKYTGFAWGFGLDRLVMIKNKIEEIRWLHSGKLDFITQFK